MAVLDLFRVLAPEFASTGDSSVEAVIDLVTLWLDAPTFGVRMSEAVARLAAHVLTLSARAAAAGSTGAAGVGPVSSVKDGDLAIGYGGLSGLSSLSASDAALATTTHGLEFIAIRNSRACTRFGILT